MTSIEEGDKRLLDEIQQDFPLVFNPFEVIGRVCDLSESQVLTRLRELASAGIIREISAILDANSIGYKTTLAAAQVEADSISRVASRINGHPGVSHNYLRNHRYNMWFTLAVEREREFQEEIERLLENEAINFLILPAIRTFKIRVNFQFSGKRKTENRIDQTWAAGDSGLTGMDKSILSLLQNKIDIVSHPWAKIAEALEMSEEALFDKINQLKQTGAVRRISGVLRHRQIGFMANGMACFNIPERDIAEAGGRAAEFPEVSHCYQRQTCPEWPYSLYTMVHGKTEDETDSLIKKIAELIECGDYLILYSSRELKKSRVRYFKEPSL